MPNIHPSFFVEITMIRCDVGAKLNDGYFKNHFRIRFEGFVRVADVLDGTSVYGDFWTATEEHVKEIQSAGRVGSAVISKDAPEIKDVSLDTSRPLAGIEIHIPLSEEEIFKLRDSLSLADASTLSIKFECTNDDVFYSSKGSAGEVALEDEDVNLKITSFSFTFKIQRSERAH